ncbi:MAG: DUF2258 domain-containing protein [Candidatus Nezhaarchaeales archaeon]|nr:MAG: DUF2258 domain-containing protein [Candidatus Nezhaarchaeota archaeon WYZ-LMO8]TDA36200.1 MAG: DUF2258 domain-containing protein [Candidatus Nezhaarchaeota archaeon WYZ-LMO7]
MALLSTGFIIAGAYADKVRKTLFAQLREYVKRGDVSSQEVARAIAELNRALYHILVERLKSDKGDVVRARIEYEIEDGKLTWKYDTLQLEVFKRLPDEDVRRVVKETVAEIEKVLERVIAYKVEKAVVTTIGDHLFRVKVDDKVVGALAVTTVNNEIAIVRGAVLEPTPVVIDKSKLPLNGGSVDEVISNNITDLVRSARNVELSEAERAIKGIEVLIESELREEKARVEKEEEVEY